MASCTRRWHTAAHLALPAEARPARACQALLRAVRREVQALQLCRRLLHAAARPAANFCTNFEAFEPGILQSQACQARQPPPHRELKDRRRVQAHGAALPAPNCHTREAASLPLRCHATLLWCTCCFACVRPADTGSLNDNTPTPTGCRAGPAVFLWRIDSAAKEPTGAQVSSTGWTSAFQAGSCGLACVQQERRAAERAHPPTRDCRLLNAPTKQVARVLSNAR